MPRRGGVPASAVERRRKAAASGQRRRLDRDAIIAVTLELIDAEGVDGVSMRRVAAEFDTGPASLYAYVSNKEALLRAVFDAVSEEVAIPEHGPWQEVIRSWVSSQRAVLRAHRDLARVSFAHVPSGPRMLEILDQLLGSMSRGGVPPVVAAWAVDAIALYLTAHVYEDYLLTNGKQDSSGQSSRAAGVAAIDEATAQFASVDPLTYPHVHTHLGQMVSGDHEARFDFGLNLLIAGIEHAVAQAD